MALCARIAAAADVYDTAVANPARSADDLKRDKLDHPAELLRLAGIKPGMRVVDLLAADGYYSEILSDVVGPTGHVLMLNNAAYDHWSDGGWQKRIAANRLPNVEPRTIDLNQMNRSGRPIGSCWSFASAPASRALQPQIARSRNAAAIDPRSGR